MKKKGSLKDIVNRVSIAIVEREQPPSVLRLQGRIWRYKQLPCVYRMLFVTHNGIE